MSYSSGEAAEQIVRMSLEGAEFAAKISGKAAERIAILLYTILKDTAHGAKKTRGKSRLVSMLRSGKPLKVFSLNDGDLKRFAKEAKKYGVLYCVLKDKTARDGHTDIFVRADDAAKINRIIERFGLATADMAQVQGELERTHENTGSDIPVPDRSTTEKDREDSFLDALLAPAPNREETEMRNPTGGPTTESRPSGPSSERQQKTETDFYEFRTYRDRRSVRQELQEIREEQKQRAAASAKETHNLAAEHIPVPVKIKDKEKEK